MDVNGVCELTKLMSTEMMKLLKLSLTPWKLPKESREQLSLQMIINFEAIWNLRNQITHNGGEINLISTHTMVERLI